MIQDVADLDCVYLSYEEPEKEEFWVKIQNMVPWAKRVDGVKGSDAAHKAAAEASDTDRFVLIDGDNIPDPEFFNQQLQITDENKDHVFRWKAVNAVNGLMYGNGGLSIWTKEFVQNMKTHENSDGSDENNVEFCYDPKYIAMHNVYSTTYPNQSEQQAWQAGFREGVKMCLVQGVKPTLEEFNQMVHARNLDNLLIWMNVGVDAKNGGSAMYGARFGVYKTMLTDWDYTEVQDFDVLNQIYTDNPYSRHGDVLTNSLTQSLVSRLNLPIVDYNVEQSKFFKEFYVKQHKQMDFMTTEISVIRNQEGW